MNVLYIMIPIAVLIAGTFLFGFLWAVNRGQYDDLDTPPQRILNED